MNDEISSRGGEGPVAFYGRKDELQTLLSAREAAAGQAAMGFDSCRNRRR